MKAKRFVPSRVHNKNVKKTTSFWEVLFISLLFLSAISSFLFANHTDRSQLQSTLNAALSVTRADTGLIQKN